MLIKLVNLCCQAITTLYWKTLINTPTCYIDLLIASTLRVVSAICLALILASSIIFSESIIALFKINGQYLELSEIFH